MKNVLLMIQFTLREALAQKVFIFFLIISLLVIIGTAILFAVADTDSLVANFNPSNDQMLLGEIVNSIALLIISPLASLCLLLAIFSSSSFIPNMLEKGNIDLLLSKPVSRMQLLIGKYLGGILVILISISILIIGVWVVISLKFSYWDFSILWVIGTVSFTFAVLYSIIVFFGVISQSSIFGMMVAYFIFLILSPLLAFVRSGRNVLIENDFVRSLVDIFYYIIPKTSELMTVIQLDLVSGKSIGDYQPIFTSFLFLVLIMTWSIFLFKRKDF
jgi:ABC-2 type transport system permease protein